MYKILHNLHLLAFLVIFTWTKCVSYDTPMNTCFLHVLNILELDISHNIR